ncbi:MAG: response regulator [bacterium]
MKTILLCDDSQFIRKRVKAILFNPEFNFLEAGDGEEALKCIKSDHVDLIILDMLMPKVTGKEVLATMFEENVNIPVIVLSADIQESTIKYCLEKGASAFLNKPPKNEDLIEKVKAILNIRI